MEGQYLEQDIEIKKFNETNKRGLTSFLKIIEQ